MRTLALYLPLVLLAFVLAQLNHSLGGWQIHVFAAGLFVAQTALRWPRRSTLAALLLAGLTLDAISPVPFGTHAALLAIAFFVIRRLRERLPHDETFVKILVALFANLALFFALSFQQVGIAPSPGYAWLRLLADLVASQLVLALIAPWFFSLQEASLRLARQDPSI